MPLRTTTIGSYPKPPGTPVPGWFQDRKVNPNEPTKTYTEFIRDQAADAGERLDQATQAVVREQAEIGIDIPTDGEVRREHYIYYHLRHIQGFDFDRLTGKTMRDGSWQAQVPTVVGKLAAGRPFLPQDWRVAQAVTDHPVKITVPGPLTIMDSTADAHYGDNRELAMALATVLNAEIRALAEAGCIWIQVDEPIFARQPQNALDYGVAALSRCFEGVPDHVNRAVHICCGYPGALDLEDFPKADAHAYFDLAAALEAAPVDAVSLEDAHRHNDLSLLDQFTDTSVILGVINVAQTRVEGTIEIAERLTAALEHIDAERLIVGPDCGLIMLPPEIARAKLQSLVAAVRTLGHA